MLSIWKRLASIVLIFTIAGCASSVNQPLPANVSNEMAPAVSPNNWFHTWKFYVKNEAKAYVKQFARDTNCMQRLPEPRVYTSNPQPVEQSLETSHDPGCYLKESDVTFDYFSEHGGGWGTVKWTKPFFFNYTLKSVASHGLCFVIHNFTYRQLEIRHCAKKKGGGKPVARLSDRSVFDPLPIR